MDRSAKIQAMHIRHLAIKAGLNISNDLTEFMTALFYFPTGAYAETWKRHNQVSVASPHSWKNWLRDGGDRAVRQYLEQQERHSRFTLPEGNIYAQWEERVSEIAKRVHKESLPDYLSGTECPLIALPYFVNETRAHGRVASAKKITNLLDELSDLIKKAEALSSDPECAARKLLSRYAGYGYRWMAFARCTVPVREPFTITVSEKRAIHFRQASRSRKFPVCDNVSNTAWQMISFADAETNHVSIEVPDKAVRLSNRCKVFGEKDLKNETTQAEDEEKTFELYLRHDTTPHRNERIWIKTPLRLTRLHSLMLYLTMAITAFGLALLPLRGVSQFKTNDAALILIPVAFAASFLLIRDASTLGARIKQKRQFLLMLELFALLAMAFTLYACHHIQGELRSRPTSPATVRPSPTSSPQPPQVASPRS